MSSNLKTADQPTLLSIEDLVVQYTSRRWTITANDRVSLEVLAGSTYAIIGESGCGKSTLAKALCGLIPKTSGTIRLGDVELGSGRRPAQLAGRTGVQIVMQDPMASLDQRWPISRSVAESRTHRREPSDVARASAVEALAEVGIPEPLSERLPSQLSGGQRQRVTIARAIAAEPRLIVLDEAVSALDVSVRNEVLHLLEDLKARHDLTYLFISHDMSVVTQSATHVAVMYLGQVVEAGTTRQVVNNRLHPYTQALLSAVPTIGRSISDRLRMVGEFPSASNPPPGCRFHTRCPFAQDLCREVEPALVEHGQPGHVAACHFAGDLADPQPPPIAGVSS